MKPKLISFLLVVILVIAAFLRLYRTSDFLGFWFDQGRDAQVIWDLLHQGRFFLIGPTTGIEGIFLGPFYYYLIAPAYLLGGGNPLFPAYFVSLLNLLSIYFLFKMGSRYFHPIVGLIAAFISAFSLQLVGYQRWLANPSPLPLLAILSLWALLAVVSHDKKWYWWPILGIGIGLSLQLEAASATFFIPATIIVLFLYRRSIVNQRIWVALFFFGLTLLPQIIFNFRHQNILFNSFQKFLVSERSFQPDLTTAYQDRLRFYYTIFTNKYFHSPDAALAFVIILPILFFWVRRYLPTKPMVTLFIWWLTPLAFLLFYYGNHGYIWDYYFTGIYPAFTLLICATGFYIFKHSLVGKVIVLSLFITFIHQNLIAHLNFFRPALPGYISLTSELQAVDWVYQDAGTTPFNQDAYVPPVIPYAYDYLFLWLGTTKYNRLPEQEKIFRLYTLYEVDPPHPERLEAWLARQAGIARIESQATFGGITVQRRTRI